MDKAKPFDIPKHEVWEAFKRAKTNQGAAGVDSQSIEQFEEDSENNLYRLWNRLCSGSYFPPAVRRVGIPKDEKSTGSIVSPTLANLAVNLRGTDAELLGHFLASEKALIAQTSAHLLSP